MNTDDIIRRADGRISMLSWKQKILTLFILTVLVYGSGIMADVISVENGDKIDHVHADLAVYQNRTQTIIDGGLLYKDTHTETPPLINYIMVPAQLLGGADHFWVWSAYFSLFAFLTAAMLYLAFRRYDDSKAFLVAVFALFCPFLVSESTICEDEAIMAFVFMVAVMLMFFNKKKASAVAIAMGIWTKMFPILLFPTDFLRQRGWKDRTVQVLILIGVTALIAGPFILLCNEEFSEFLEFYFLGDSNRQTGGQSIWHFLRMGGLVLPKGLELTILVGGLGLTYLFCYFKKLGIWESTTLALLAFFILYPKIHTGYYTILFIMLAVWAVENKKVALRIFAAWVPIVITSLFSELESGKAFIEFEGSWLVGLALSLIGTLLFVDAARIALKERPFIYGDAVDGPEVAASVKSKMIAKWKARSRRSLKSKHL